MGAGVSVFVAAGLLKEPMGLFAALGATLPLCDHLGSVSTGVAIFEAAGFEESLPRKRKVLAKGPIPRW